MRNYLPRYVTDILKEAMPLNEVEIAEQCWYTFSNGLSLSNSSKEEIVREGKMVVECYYTVHGKD